MTSSVGVSLPVAGMQSLQAAPQFYRRVLPQTCIDFSSEEGKQLFVGALNEGNANIYFKVAAQFLTQEEPSFCGLSTLVMVLNALEVDPARVWKGAWRWYHESMLDCCIPLEVVLKIGITADQFECLARCNRLNIIRHNPPSLTASISDEEKTRSIDQFRNSIVQTVRSIDKVLVVSYCRKTLGQTGLGHFSPLAAYNSAMDKVLLMDVARFKYPPHWVSVSLLWESMREIDADTNRPRAYFILSLNEKLKPMLFLRLIEPVTMKAFVQRTEQWLRGCDSICVDPKSDVDKLSIIFVERMFEELKDSNLLEIREDYRFMADVENATECGRCCGVTDKQLATLVRELVDALEKTAEFKYLKKFASVESEQEQTGIQHRRALLTVGLFLSWPFETESHCQLCVDLAKYCRAAIEKLPGSAQNEVASLKSQIVALLGANSRKRGGGGRFVRS